jgi:hypothetical protein
LLRSNTVRRPTLGEENEENKSQTSHVESRGFGLDDHRLFGIDFTYPELLRFWRLLGDIADSFCNRL